VGEKMIVICTVRRVYVRLYVRYSWFKTKTSLLLPYTKQYWDSGGLGEGGGRSLTTTFVFRPIPSSSMLAPKKCGADMKRTKQCRKRQILNTLYVHLTLLKCIRQIPLYSTVYSDTRNIGRNEAFLIIYFSETSFPTFYVYALCTQCFATTRMDPRN
jgi:hypothetical protein